MFVEFTHTEREKPMKDFLYQLVVQIKVGKPTAFFIADHHT